MYHSFSIVLLLFFTKLHYSTIPRVLPEFFPEIRTTSTGCLAESRPKTPSVKTMFKQKKTAREECYTYIYVYVYVYVYIILYLYIMLYVWYDIIYVYIIIYIYHILQIYTFTNNNWWFLSRYSWPNWSTIGSDRWLFFRARNLAKKSFANKPSGVDMIIQHGIRRYMDV